MPELSSAIMKGIMRDLKADAEVNKRIHSEQISLNDIEALIQTKDGELVFGKVTKFDQYANVWLNQPMSVDSSGSSRKLTIKLNGQDVEVKSALFHNSFIKSLYVISGQVETLDSSNDGPTYEVMSGKSEKDKPPKTSLKKTYEIK